MPAVEAGFDVDLASGGAMYTDGEPRPQLRGVLHMIVACVLPIGLVVLVVTYPAHWPLALFVAGKEASYLSSVLFHRWVGVGPSLPRHLASRMADKFAICVSIAASGVPTSFHATTLFYIIEGVLLLLCAVLVMKDQQLSAGEKSPERMRFRIFMIVQFIFTIAFIGWASKPAWNPIWICGTVAYIAGFSMFGIGEALRKGQGSGTDHASVLPWHKEIRNGPHEDFHAGILLGDVVYFMNAVYHGNY
jgi:predicted membrane channel-forming protein YqfA (hemolysin III family)